MCSSYRIKFGESRSSQRRGRALEQVLCGGGRQLPLAAASNGRYPHADRARVRVQDGKRPHPAERLGVQVGEFLISVSSTRQISFHLLPKDLLPNRRRMHQHTVGFEPTKRGWRPQASKSCFDSCRARKVPTYAEGRAHAHRCALRSTGKELTYKHILPVVPKFCTEKKLRTHLSPQLFCLMRRSRMSVRKRSGASTSTRGPKESTRTSSSVSSSVS